VTLLGPDLYNGQAGLDLSHLTQASFVFAKVTEGTYYTDASYRSFRTQAAALGAPFVWYHFLTTQDVAAQVAHTKANLVDAGVPGMLDVEPQLQAGSRPTLGDITAYADIAASAGLNLRLVYLPHWYWQQIGSPDLTPLAKRGLHLVSSSYPGGTGSPAALYPGDSAVGWTSYGGMVPAFYQFTNQASDGGWVLDYNAFRGTLDDLRTLLGGSTMATTIPATISQKWPDLATEFPANAAYDDSNAIIWSDAGARAAALYAKQALDAVNALAAKVSQPPAVDVRALAVELAPLLTAGATADEVAAAVAAHFAADLAKG
jgi:hypothetical protein